MEKEQQGRNNGGWVKREWKILVMVAALISTGSVLSHRVGNIEAKVKSNLLSDTTDHERIIILETNYEHIRTDIGNVKSEVGSLKRKVDEMRTMQQTILDAVRSSQ